VDVRQLSGRIYSQELPIQILRWVQNELEVDDCFNFCALSRTGIRNWFPQYFKLDQGTSHRLPGLFR
jgi:hypothetical protein